MPSWLSRPSSALAYRALERHRPVRAAWATRLAQRPWLPYFLDNANPMFLGPVIAVPVFSQVSSGSQSMGRIIEDAALALVVVGLVTWSIWGLVIQVLKRTCVLESRMPGVPCELAYVKSCPRLERAVRTWIHTTQSPALSVHEIALIRRIVLTADLKPVLAATSCSTPVPIDEKFYELFPDAPRFAATDAAQVEGFGLFVAAVDHLTGHLDLARARLAARRLDADIPPAPPGLTSASSSRPRM